MKMILTIGFDDYIVPEGVNAVKLYETLAKLRPCRDHSYMRENPGITVRPKMVELHIKSIPMGAKLVTVKEKPELSPLQQASEELDAAREPQPFDDGKDIPL